MIKEDEKLDTDTVVEEIEKEKEEEEQKLKIVKRPELLNETAPLWTKLILGKYRIPFKLNG